MTITVKNPKSAFIHIPKTGGTSIDLWIRQQYSKGMYNSKGKHENISTPKDCFTFCVVRNPWDRMVSGYFYYVKKKAAIVKNKDIKSFEEFLLYRDYGKTLKISQSEYALKNPHAHILRFENLQEEFKKIQKFYNSKKPLEIKNKSNHKDYVEYYTKQWMIDQIAEDFKDDVLNFNYAFEYKYKVQNVEKPPMPGKRPRKRKLKSK